MSRTDLRGSISIARQETVEVIGCRELEETDILSALQHQLPAELGATPHLRQLRSSHHVIARLLAAGLNPTEVSKRTGYSNSRISVLQNDPAFKELLEFYGNEQSELASNMVERLASLSTDAMDVMQERLEDDPESFTNSQLTEIIKTGADRSDAPPVTKSINLNQNSTIDIKVVKQIKEELLSGEKGNVKFIERTAETVSAETSAPQITESAECLVEEGGTALVGTEISEEEIEGICGKGISIREKNWEAMQEVDSTGRVIWNPV